MLQLEVLIWELLPIDGLPASTIASCEVSTLDHEVLDHSVEGRALIAKALLACSKGTEVLCCLGDGATIETNGDSSELFIAVCLP